MSTNDAMKDIERLIEAFEDDCLEDGENREAYRAEECKPSSSRQASRAALLAAIGKLVASTQPAMSQDAQPVARLQAKETPEGRRLGLFDIVILDRDRCRDDMLLYSHPPIPQEGKVMEALEPRIPPAVFRNGQWEGVPISNFPGLQDAVRRGLADGTLQVQGSALPAQPTDEQITAALRAACLHDTPESRKDMRKALIAFTCSAWQDIATAIRKLGAQE
jgi:hypothetical protein